MRCFAPALSVLILAACSEAAPPAPAASDATASPAATANTGSAAPQPPQPSPTPTRDTPPTIADLGLAPGVFAAAGSNCPPSMASLAIFDGKGFSSRNAAACIFLPAERSGASFAGRQTCTDPSSQERITDDLTVTVASTTRFTRIDKWGTTTFDLCPGENLSAWTG